MNIDIRQAILTNVSGHNPEQIEQTIMDALQRGDEVILPGLGVLFEVFWNGASEEEKDRVLQTISNEVK